MTQKYTLKDYWNFITHGNNHVFEVRTTSFKLAKLIGEKFNVPYSYNGGVFVKSYEELYNIVFFARKMKQTIWISVNPKRKVTLPNYKFKTYTAKDEGIEYIMNIMIDLDNIDRKGNPLDVMKNKPHILSLAREMLKNLRAVGFESYMIVDSGGGYQIVLPIEPLYMPVNQLDKTGKFLIPSETFLKYKTLVKSTIGTMIARKYGTKEYKRDYFADVDTSSFNIGRVMSLHGTFNFKYELNTPVTRRVVDINIKEGNEENKGVLSAMLRNLVNLPDSEYIAKRGDVKLAMGKYGSEDVYGESRTYTFNTIRRCRLVQMLLNKKLPEGGRHSHLIFPLKVLLMRCSIDFNRLEVRNLFSQINYVQEKQFPFNPPPPFSVFSINTVNKYCMQHNLELVYEPLPNNIKDPDVIKYFNEYNHVFSYASYIKSRKTIEEKMPYVYDSEEFFDRDIHKHMLFMRSIFKDMYKEKVPYDVRNHLYSYLYMLEKIYDKTKIKNIIEKYLYEYIRK